MIQFICINSLKFNVLCEVKICICGGFTSLLQCYFLGYRL